MSSCISDFDDYTPDVLEGRTWTGNIGLRADNGEPLFSSFRFGTDGFGTEYQYYAVDAVYHADFRFRWFWESEYEDNIVLDYGKYGFSYMDDVRVRNRELTGTFYLNKSDLGYDFRLFME